MKIESQPLEDHQVRLIAEFDGETLEKYKRQAAREISKSNKIPGFRPGKAPFEVIKRLYGEELIEKQAIELLLDDAYPQVLQEADVKPSGPGTLEEIINTNPPKLSFTVPLAPEVQLCDYRSIRKEYHEETVTEDEVEAAIKSLQANFSTVEPVNRPVQDGDLVYIKINGRILDPAEGEEAEFIKDTSLQIVVGNTELDPDDWPFTGFSKEMVGLSEGGEKSILHTTPQDSPFESARGRKVEYRVQIEAVKEMKLPELDEEFLKSLGDFESLDDFRSNLRSQLEERKQREYDQSYLNELVDEIVGQSTIKYPPHVVEEEIEEVLRSIESDLARQRLDLETYIKSRDQEREAFIEEEVKPIAKKRVERSLVIEEIGKGENIELNKQELENEFAQTMSELQNLQARSKKRGGDLRKLANAVALQTANRLYNRNIMDRLKTIASGKLENTGKEAAEEPATETAEVSKPKTAKKTAKTKPKKDAE